MDSKGTISRKKYRYLGVFTYPIAIFWVEKAKIVCLRSRWLRGNAISVFVIEYICENEKVRETYLTCSYVALIEYFAQKK